MQNIDHFFPSPFGKQCTMYLFIGSNQCWPIIEWKPKIELAFNSIISQKIFIINYIDI
jgi:hypothetical protein